MHRSPDSIKNPLFRFHEREVVILTRLLNEIRDDLEAVQKVRKPKAIEASYLHAVVSLKIYHRLLMVIVW